MDTLPMISILVVIFAMILLGEQMKLKKEVRRLQNLTKHLKNDIEKKLLNEMENGEDLPLYEYFENSKDAPELIKLLQKQGFDGIKIIKLLGREKFFYNKFKVHNVNLSKIATITYFFQGMPRLLLELVGILFVTFSLYILYSSGNSFVDFLPKSTRYSNPIIDVGNICRVSFISLIFSNIILFFSESSGHGL